MLGWLALSKIQQGRKHGQPTISLPPPLLPIPEKCPELRPGRCEARSLVHASRSASSLQDQESGLQALRAWALRTGVPFAEGIENMDESQLTWWNPEIPFSPMAAPLFPVGFLMAE